MYNIHVFSTQNLRLWEKITIVLDNKPTKIAWDFEENKFSVGCHQFLLHSCPKLIKTYILDKM
jgi:hypothetical protein